MDVKNGEVAFARPFGDMLEDEHLASDNFLDEDLATLRSESADYESIYNRACQSRSVCENLPLPYPQFSVQVGVPVEPVPANAVDVDSVPGPLFATRVALQN
jgi:hypothetical protein